MSQNLTDARPTTTLETDVLVVGGGAAGVAAAVTAAEQGVRVLLVERYGFCGGGAVAGMSGTICGLYEASDDPRAQPKQLVHGFVDRFIKAMEQMHGLTGPVRYGKTFTRVHDPLVWRQAADELLARARVKILFHSVVTDVLMDGPERVAGVLVYTKQGKVRISARITIDASGDADVIAMAGLPSFVGDNGRTQNPTMIFRIQNVDVERFLTTYGPDSIMDDSVSMLIHKLHAAGEYDLPRAKIFLFKTPRPHELLCNATRIVGADGREINPLLIEDLTEAEIVGRAQVREYARFFKAHIAGCENAYVNDTGVQVGIRQSRQAEGLYVISNEDVISARKFDTGIARSPWPIELHSGAKPRLVWLLNDYYDVPYECFVPVKGESILVAGRCLSAQHEAMASARVTAQCFSYGHAIGHAAAIAVLDNVEPRSINAFTLRERLNRDGAQLS